MERESKSTCFGMIVTFVILFFAGGVKAQTPTIVNPSISVTPIQIDTVVTSVNCDMVRCPKYGLGALKAVVWSVTPVYAPHRVTSYLFVEFNGTALPIESIPDAVDIDVVITDDNSGKDGLVYNILVIYENAYTDQIFIRDYALPLASSPLALNIRQTQQISGGSNLCSHPRIDMFSDWNSSISGSSVFVRALYKYVACWMEDNGSTIDVIGALGTISTLTPYTTFTVETGAQYPDVAAFTGVNTTAGDSAVFVYDGGYELWNVTSTPTGAYAGSTSMTKSRVEAMNFQGTFGVNNARWTAVGHEFNSPYYEVKVVNNLQSGYLSTSLLSGYLGHDQAYPVVAAGNGYPGLQYIGNHQYTTAWYDFGTSYDVYSQDVAFTTGLPVSSSDYYKVSNSSFTDPYINAAGTGSKNSSIAISNSTNDGYGLLTAYFDGEYMVYKYSSTGTNTYNFKPTRIQKVVSKTFGIYPNPASDRINITGSEGNDYNILDMMGRTQLSGTLFDNGDIDISSLASGLHLVELEDKGEKKTTRFVKQ